jgi:hypothetical protein
MKKEAGNLWTGAITGIVASATARLLYTEGTAAMARDLRVAAFTVVPNIEAGHRPADCSAGREAGAACSPAGQDARASSSAACGTRPSARAAASLKNSFPLNPQSSPLLPQRPAFGNLETRGRPLHGRVHADGRVVVIRHVDLYSHRFAVEGGVEFQGHQPAASLGHPDIVGLNVCVLRQGAQDR